MNIFQSLGVIAASENSTLKITSGSTIGKIHHAPKLVARLKLLRRSTTHRDDRSRRNPARRQRLRSGQQCTGSYSGLTRPHPLRPHASSPNTIDTETVLISVFSTDCHDAVSAPLSESLPGFANFLNARSQTYPNSKQDMDICLNLIREYHQHCNSTERETNVASSIPSLTSCVSDNGITENTLVCCTTSTDQPHMEQLGAENRESVNQPVDNPLSRPCTLEKHDEALADQMADDKSNANDNWLELLWASSDFQ